MSAFVDTYVAYKIIQILSTPWKETEAYRLGIIDEHGKILKKRVDLKPSEKAAYTAVHTVIWNIKKILDKFPPTRTKLGSMAAALFLLKESVQKEWPCSYAMLQNKDVPVEFTRLFLEEKYKLDLTPYVIDDKDPEEKVTEQEYTVIVFYYMSYHYTDLFSKTAKIGFIMNFNPADQMHYVDIETFLTSSEKYLKAIREQWPTGSSYKGPVRKFYLTDPDKLGHARILISSTLAKFIIVPKNFVTFLDQHKLNNQRLEYDIDKYLTMYYKDSLNYKDFNVGNFLKAFSYTIDEFMEPATLNQILTKYNIALDK